MGVDEQAHELGNGHGGMRVVELHGDLFRQLQNSAVSAKHIIDNPGMYLGPAELDVRSVAKGLQDVLQRCRGEEVLLDKPQHLAVVLAVVGVQDLGDGLHLHLLLDGLHVLAIVELDKIKIVGGVRAPQPQRAHRARAMPWRRTHRRRKRRARRRRRR